VWIIGAFQFALGEGLLHEACHLNLFRTRWLNTFGELFFAYPFFLSMGEYRKYHLAHHADLFGASDYIPEIYGAFGLVRPKRSMTWLWLIRPVLGLRVGYYFLIICPRSVRHAAKLILTLGVMVGTFAWFGRLDVLVMYWLVPLLWVFPCFEFWSETAEHLNTQKSASRSNVGKIWNWINHNTGFHHLHHEHPTIPWHQLPRAHAELCPANTDITHGFWDTFRQIITPHESSVLERELASKAGAP
jgi:fatty acid desaturase